MEGEGRAVTDHRAAYDDGQLPWLQAVEDEDEPRGVSARKMLAALGVVLLAGLLVAATFFWLGRRDTVNGPAELIHAPPGPYKVKPPTAGGLDIAGESETAFETSAGQDKDAQLDLSKVPETPVSKSPKEEPKPGFSADVKATAKPAPAEESKPAGPAGSVIQLGAFANQAQAERAWSALSARFPPIAAMNKLVIPFTGGIRLRAAAPSPAEAKQACQTLKAAGENCFVAQ
jgi:hypothetical protein